MTSPLDPYADQQPPTPGAPAPLVEPTPGTLPAGWGATTVAHHLGRWAARRGLPPAAMPHDPGSADPHERGRASAWMHGYLAQRPPTHGTVDYTDDDADEGRDTDHDGD